MVLHQDRLAPYQPHAPRKVEREDKEVVTPPHSPGPSDNAAVSSPEGQGQNGTDFRMAPPHGNQDTAAKDTIHISKCSGGSLLEERLSSVGHPVEKVSCQFMSYVVQACTLPVLHVIPKSLLEFHC